MIGPQIAQPWSLVEELCKRGDQKMKRRGRKERKVERSKKKKAVVCSRLAPFELAVWEEGIDIEGSNSMDGRVGSWGCEVWLIGGPSSGS